MYLRLASSSQLILCDYADFYINIYYASVIQNF